MAITRKQGRGKTPGEWLSLPKAAAALGRHRQTVAHMALRGELESITIDDRLFVSRADVERAAEQQEAAA